jgi:recombinational DNA repair protein (RecF pathway)
LTRTQCCNQLICDDEDQYVLFSYARNSCHRNHRRYTLCGMHEAEGHDGNWKSCARCRAQIDKTELYVYYGTNEYNFERLENPPAFEPTVCDGCGRILRLAEEGYSVSRGGYFCEPCTAKRMRGLHVGGSPEA